ncbi:VC1465 family Xer recombination activation factor [Xanthomonas campestris]|uniref:VC1465 family Xer recombination activation factor n=1 Tax=Xanthomonas campestris TaxID=339 RepID=UPI003D00795B
MSNTQFRDARIFGGFTREEAARFLNVSVRTIGHWETGRVRPTYAAFKLLRIYRHGDLIHPAWADCSISHRGALVTPEGHEIKPADLAWLSLLFRRAEAMGSLLRERDQLRHRLQQIDQASAGEAGPRPWACLFLNK